MSVDRNIKLPDLISSKQIRVCCFFRIIFIKSNIELILGQVSSPYWPVIKSNIELSLYTVETQLFQMTSAVGERGTCIKGLIWPHLEPESKVAIH